MTRRFEGKSCIFCPKPSSRGGEHVWTEWFLKMFPLTDGPYTTLEDGEPIQDRNGNPRTQTSIRRVKVPMCNGDGEPGGGCNGELNRRFEEPAKLLVRKLMASDGDIVFDGQQATIVGLWLLKTWLLLAHPLAEDSQVDIPALRWTSATDDLWSWMVASRPPPEGLSVWANKRSAPPNDQTPTRRVPLPTVIADGREIEFLSSRAGVRFLDVGVVYHPGWEIDHPLEREGRALRLWPRDSDQPADFARLPPVDTNDTNWLSGPRLHFYPGTFASSNLPPLSASLTPMQLMDLPAVEAAAW
jgi:hypothetical protein